MSAPLFGEPFWHWESKNNDIRLGQSRVGTTVTVADLLAHVQEIAPGVGLDDVKLISNYASLRWSRPATAEELAERAQRLADAEAKHADYARRFLADLARKHGVEALRAMVEAIEPAEETS